jgi:hypothetical protein
MSALKCVAAASLMLVVGCSQPEWQEFEARAATYRFPSRQVSSVTTSPHRFIRVSPAGEPFELVYDSRIDLNVDRRGHPQIFSINRALLTGKSYTPTPAGMIVCQTSVASVNCGTTLSVNGDRWSVLFPASRKTEIVAISTRAARFLSSHTLRTGVPPATTGG